jgi:hypothetical protein
MNREILQQALYLIESWQRGADAHEYFEIDDVIAALKTELALDRKADNFRELGLDYEPEQESVFTRRIK